MIRLMIAMLALTFLLGGCEPAATTMKTEGDKKIETDQYGCRIERYSIHSKAMDKDINIAVVLPPEYDKNPQKRYPVIFTLHGARAPYDTFANMPRLRKMLKDMPMIYTCFEAKLSSYLDWPTNPKMKYDTFFFKEFAPYIESHYRTNGQRGVGGFSMGGSGAMYYTLRKPDMFVATCCLSTGLRQTSGTDPKQRGRWANRYGDYESNKAFYESIDPRLQITKRFKAGDKLPALMLRCGTEDGAIKGMKTFCDLLIELNAAKSKELRESLTGKVEAKKISRKVAELMTKEGLNFTFAQSPGGHNWTYWHGQAQEFAFFFWDAFQNAGKK